MKKSTVTFIFDVLLVRKYKWRIFLANVAGGVLIVAYSWIKDVREERKFKRSLESPDQD